MDAEVGQRSRTVQSVDRAVALLRALADVEQPVSLAALASSATSSDRRPGGCCGPCRHTDLSSASGHRTATGWRSAHCD